MKRPHPKPAPKRPQGGQIKWRMEDHAQSVLDHVAAGKALHDWTKAGNGARPGPSTVFQWIHESPAFAEQYSRAREQAAHKLASEIVSIADGPGDPHDKRVRVEARKWIASKLMPRVYGDKIDVNHTGAISLETLITASLRPAIEAAASGTAGATTIDHEPSTERESGDAESGAGAGEPNGPAA